MKPIIAAVAALSFSLSAVAAYEPMAPFKPLDGRAFSAEWTDENGKAVIDVATYELILGGRALQSTHRIKGSSYGGRTIYFYDEARKAYFYHYFTTAGFHTQGTAALNGDRIDTVEEVSGHPTIARVKGTASVNPDDLFVAVVYVGKDGSETAAPTRRYRPIEDPGPLFPEAALK